jgi:hypothetical protein
MSDNKLVEFSLKYYKYMWYFLHWHQITLKYNVTLFLKQGIASIFHISILVGFPSLYATLVCVACSQLEKLRASLLEIRQTHVTAERDRGTDTELQEAQGQDRASQELFRNMQQQLNDCIRHHQEIKLYVQNK